MAASLFFALMLFLFIIIQTTAQSLPIDPRLQLEQANLKISQLEVIFEEKIRDINAVNSYIEQKEKAIEAATLEINRLPIDLLSTTKDDLSQAQERLNDLEKEVRRLWGVARGNNFEIHNLELKARDAQERWEATLSRIGNMVEIVSERWIQVQHLEQAVQMAKLRTLKVKTELILIKCPFFKYFSNAFSHHVEELKENLTPYIPGKGSQNSLISLACNQLSRFFTATKYFHHQLQGMVKQALESHNFTKVLANEEVVFFMASAVILFPMMSAWVLLWMPRK
ncbi:hypothetical protein LIER_17223 [Lithospermum erythrorhizon]|uniref:Uncharacterized protein n=1 Tax=Lithospermum erythrorhizon TaxID=34254 RepID=A0AAV3QA99_LITER